jgi:hypothetical protein
MSKEDIRSQIENVDGELVMIHKIIASGDRPSLVFENELYLVRHLLTEAKERLTNAVELRDMSGADETRALDAALLGARIAYKAALISLNAAEQLLPTKMRTINGESFWDRFNRISNERESEAARSFIP